MLVLTRHEEQSIIIEVDGKLIKVKILGINSKQVKVGIDADRSIPVHREEVFEIIAKNITEAQPDS